MQDCVRRSSFFSVFTANRLHRLASLLALSVLLACAACTRSHSQTAPATSPADLKLDVSVPFQFVAYGDSRFHDPKDTEAANPPVRQAAVSLSNTFQSSAS